MMISQSVTTQYVNMCSKCAFALIFGKLILYEILISIMTAFHYQNFLFFSERIWNENIAFFSVGFPSKLFHGICHHTYNITAASRYKWFDVQLSPFPSFTNVQCYKFNTFCIFSFKRYKMYWQNWLNHTHCNA